MAWILSALGMYRFPSKIQWRDSIFQIQFLSLPPLSVSHRHTLSYSSDPPLVDLPYAVLYSITTLATASSVRPDRWSFLSSLCSLPLSLYPLSCHLSLPCAVLFWLSTTHRSPTWRPLFNRNLSYYLRTPTRPDRWCLLSSLWFVLQAMLAHQHFPSFHCVPAAILRSSNIVKPFLDKFTILWRLYFSQIIARAP